MTKLWVYDKPMIEAKNPWRDTPFGKKAKYIRKAHQWDERVMGQAALSKGQREAIDAFVGTSKSDIIKAKCPKKLHMETLKCRAGFMKGWLKDRKYTKKEEIEKPSKWGTGKMPPEKK